MHTSRKLLGSFIVVFFFGILVFAYKNTTQSKTNSQITSIPIASVTAKDHIRGNKDAKVTIVEYSDFECPSCVYFQPTIKQIMQTYGDKVRWVVRFYPLPQHANAEKEAEAAECVSEIGGNDAFWEFSDMIFTMMNITEDGTGLSLEKLPIFAKQVGVNKILFKKCLDSGKFYTKMQNNISNANAAGIHQFPSTIIIDSTGNMQVVVSNQPYSVYKNIIDQALTN
ncbi:MAG TPA: thioredoxin domain-containing protein [Candidatus Saccharimonadales bacterium]|nr:thioredoxin domain-containing protein [Candidatus Saccharimonadales bacterium]